ncbi:hypothetical protein HPP92_018220 [Vanilla planifolia]|uniref:Uncharacterized protein n=1 Tax=Vanilla planifolia TaxID=51239 RepID=A0A835UP65_VANPL|nr:hypothetical protein HPP92_018220 [Vanilla planifolia]
MAVLERCCSEQKYCETLKPWPPSLKKAWKGHAGHAKKTMPNITSSTSVSAELWTLDGSNTVKIIWTVQRLSSPLQCSSTAEFELYHSSSQNVSYAAISIVFTHNIILGIHEKNKKICVRENGEVRMDINFLQRWLCAASPKAFAGFQLLKSSKNTFNNCNGDSRSEGAIVAIQDVQQHMYHFVIEPVGKKYQLLSSTMESIRRIDWAFGWLGVNHMCDWDPTVDAITTSKGSSFWGVGSGISKKGGGIMRTSLGGRCSNDKAAEEEFVKKPGNQFKIKLFSTFVLSKDIAVNVSELDDTFDKYPKGETSSRGRERTEFQSVHQHINILLTKLRMLSSFSAVLHYFDSGMNIWREVLAPVEFSLFYRSRFAQPESLVGHHGVPVHFFLLISQVDILLSEISLDVLLYFVGKLDLAGPYVVRQAVIFPNCCKFQENQNVVLSQGQSSAAYLRHIALESQLPDNQNIIKIFSWIAKGFSTSPISIISSGCFFFAWRTRLASLEDSRIFPGPIVVIEVAKKNEMLVFAHNRLASLEEGILGYQKKHEGFSKFLHGGDDDSRIFPGPIVVIEVAKKNEVAEELQQEAEDALVV